jgi:tetratricopeptide (TPR) repeat protein
LLRDYRQAEEFLQQAAQAVQQAQNGLLANQILLELASGGGVNGAQRALRQARRLRRLAPQAVAGWANGFPVLLVGGELDEMIGRFSLEAEDPRYRCACYAQKAWMLRVAGRMDESRMYWDSLVTAWENDPPQPDDPDARADVQAQLARNYARAGRHEDARRALETAMSMPVSDEAVSGVRRRWAQTYAELGDVEHAVEHLEYLLSAPTLVTVHTLESRMTWAPIREEPAFQALLERHR